ncbi:MAG: glycosyltransferase family 39 protein [Verrucomicrobiota bacterium]
MTEDSTKSQNRLDRKDAIAMLVLTVLTLFLLMKGLGSYGFWDPWEPKYAITITEMVERGDYITPYYLGLPRWTKPIGIYWAMLVTSAIFGFNEFGGRLPSVLFALGAVLFTYYFLRKLHSRRVAILAADILMTIPHFFYMARQAMPDMMLTFFLCTAMGYFALARFGPPEKARLHFALFYASASLSFLTKGPVGCAIILLAMMLFWSLNFRPELLRDWKSAVPAFLQFMKAYRVWSGLVIFLVISVPWYAAEIAIHGMDYVSTFFGWESFDRFNETIRGHTGLVDYYVLTVWHGMYPWCGLFMAGLCFYAVNRLRKLDDESRIYWFYLAWATATFLLFTWAGTKLSHYILPLAPSLAVVTAFIWDDYFKKDVPAWVGPVILLTIILSVLPLRDFLTQNNKYIFDTFTSKRELRYVEVEFPLKLLGGLWAGVMLLAFLRRRSWVITILIFCVAYGNGIFFLHHAFPNHAVRRTTKFYLDTYLEKRKPHSQLILYCDGFRESMDYYFPEDEFQRFERGDEKEMLRILRNEKDMYVIVDTDNNRYFRQHVKSLGDQRWQSIRRDHDEFYLLTNDESSQVDNLERFRKMKEESGQ